MAKDSKDPKGKPPEAEEKKPAAGRKKLLMIGGVALLVAALGGGWAYHASKAAQQAEADAEEAADSESKPAASAKGKPSDKATNKDKKVPSFIKLDTMTVNLKGQERYLQAEISLETTSDKADAELKLRMPAIRHKMILAMTEMTAEELQTVDGKMKLAMELREEIRRQLSKETAPSIETVLFTSFIIQ